MNIAQDRMFHTRKDMEDQIKISLAGRVAEELIFGQDNITTGASNDIEKATEIVRDYAMRYGMNQELGMINLNVLMKDSDGAGLNQILLEESLKLMNRLYEETKALIQGHKHLLMALSQELLEKETLVEEDIDQLLKMGQKSA